MILNGKSGEPPLSPRERAFLRVVLHRMYREAWESVLDQEFMFITKNPDTPFYTSFDCNQGPDPIITVHPIPSLPRSSAQSRDWAMLWEDSVARAARSGGKMNLHLFVVGEGKGLRMRLMPMRSDSGDLHEARKRVVAQTRSGRIASTGDLERARFRDGIEIH